MPINLDKKQRIKYILIISYVSFVALSPLLSKLVSSNKENIKALAGSIWKIIEPPPSLVSQEYLTNNPLKIKLAIPLDWHVYIEGKNSKASKCLQIQKEKIVYTNYYFDRNFYPSLAVCLMGDSYGNTPGMVAFYLKQEMVKKFKNLKLGESRIIDFAGEPAIKTKGIYQNRFQEAEIHFFWLERNSRSYLIYFLAPSDRREDLDNLNKLAESIQFE